MPLNNNVFTVGNRVVESPGQPPLVEVGGRKLAYLCVEKLEASGLALGDVPLHGQVAYGEDGTKFEMQELFARSEYTVIVGACLTCGAFVESYPEIEALERDYRGSGIQFLYLYRTLAHPERNDYIEPFTIEERLMQVAESKKLLRCQVPYIADNIDNSIRLTLGDIPNPLFVFDRAGRIVYMLAWADPELLRNVMAEIAGPLEHRTDVADLDINVDYILKTEPGDLTVEPIETPELMFPLEMDVAESEHPHYAKLTAEVEPQVLDGEPGKLFLGLRMDPLYPVCWNNLAGPVWVELEQGQYLVLSETNLLGPDIRVNKDKAHREFLIDVTAIQKAQAEFGVTVSYSVCADDNTFCKTIEQSYVVRLERRVPTGFNHYRLWKGMKKKLNPAWGAGFANRIDEKQG